LKNEQDTEFGAFLARIDAAQEEFAQGRPGDFKALWSHTDEVSLSGGHGGVIELGWAKVAARLDWASSTYQEGDRSTRIVSGSVCDDFAYVVRKEIIEARIGGEAARSRQELRVTMVFRRGAEGWRIVHRHADSQTSALLPR
jgi:ketosteroid isomerase-like protein